MIKTYVGSVHASGDKLPGLQSCLSVVLCVEAGSLMERLPIFTSLLMLCASKCALVLLVYARKRCIICTTVEQANVLYIYIHYIYSSIFFQNFSHRKRQGSKAKPLDSQKSFSGRPLRDCTNRYYLLTHPFPQAHLYLSYHKVYNLTLKSEKTAISQDTNLVFFTKFCADATILNNVLPYRHTSSFGSILLFFSCLFLSKRIQNVSRSTNSLFSAF